MRLIPLMMARRGRFPFGRAGTSRGISALLDCPVVAEAAAFVASTSVDIVILLRASSHSAFGTATSGG